MSLNRPSSVEHFDRSSTIQQLENGEPQIVFPANPHRIGLRFQNQGGSPMLLKVACSGRNEDEQTSTYWKVEPGASFSFEQFAPINEISITGTLNDVFAAAEYGC